jgi:hypothetical protein
MAIVEAAEVAVVSQVLREVPVGLSDIIGFS